MHLFQGSQREIEELPGGGLSVSIELECNPVGRNIHCQPTIPAGVFNLLSSHSAHTMTLIVRTMVTILFGGSNSDKVNITIIMYCIMSHYEWEG